MSCVAQAKTFRLLDPRVGWEAKEGECKYLVGTDDDIGVRLQPLISTPSSASESDVSRYLPPARLAKDCSPCKWYLVTPAALDSRVLFRDACSKGWQELWSRHCTPGVIGDGIAIAIGRSRFAVADHQLGRVLVWLAEGQKQVADVPIEDPGPICFAPWGELLVVDCSSRAVLRLDPAGIEHGYLPAPLPDTGVVDRIGVDSQCRIWLATEQSQGVLQLWVASREASQFEPASLESLAAAFPETGIVATSPTGFCIEELSEDGLPIPYCYSWYGRSIERHVVGGVVPAQLNERGQLLTGPIDSGIPRCRWHRVRLDADIPAGTSVLVSVATSETKEPVAQGQVEPEWLGFALGNPHPKDWQKVPVNALDFLVDQPPGRYLFLRLRLIGDGQTTPRVRQIRIDFPRSTSMNYLPSVYREDPQAEDFTERFLSLFDSTLADIDQAIMRSPSLLDVDDVHPEILPWIGTFLDIGMDPAWTTERRRKVLRAAPDLYQLRGTVAGLQRAIEILFDVKPAIQELAFERSWGALNKTFHLGASRVFGRARARFRVGASTLSNTPLRSFGNPDHDPFTAQAYRFRVLVPPGQFAEATTYERLQRLVANQKPAHTVASVRVGGEGFVLGTGLSVGIDTIFAPPQAPVLGSEAARLNRRAILRSKKRGRLNTRVAQTTTVGINTVME